jgi:hypothetical protein
MQGRIRVGSPNAVATAPAEMELHKEQNFRHAIKVTENDLASLHAFLEGAKLGQVAIVARCHDGSKLFPHDLKQLLAYENPGYRSLSHIAISVGDKDGPGATVHLGDVGYGGYSSGFELVALNLRDASTLEAEITPRLEQMKAGYAWLERQNAAAASLVICAVEMAALFAYAPIVEFMGRPRPPVPESSTVVPLLFGSLALLFVAEVTIRKVCPPVVFEIGRGKDREAKRKWWRDLILRGVLISLVVSLIGKILFAFI